MNQRELNKQAIDRSSYNFIYLENSTVFHRRECKACLCASSHTKIMGSMSYTSAAENRRPCKLCKPVPLPAGKRSLKKRKHTHPKDRPVDGDEVVRTKMVDGRSIAIRRKNILGWCRCLLHPGAISRSIMKEHDCLGKKCSYLKKNKQSPYWESQETQKQAKIQRKEERKEAKAKKAQEDRRLRELTETWRLYANELYHDLQIVRVAEGPQNTYTIFYVSDNSFDDTDCYLDFWWKLYGLYPQYTILLKHIRGVDSNFVTRIQYKNR